MKFSTLASTTLFLASAATAAPAALRRQLQSTSCEALAEDYGTSTTDPLSQSKADGTFRVPQEGDFVCTLNCDASAGNDLNLFVRFGTAGASPTTNNFDAKMEGVSCGAELKAPNTAGTNPGFQYTVEASAGYTNLKLSCVCREVADPPADDNDGGGCFSSTDTVQVINQGKVAMKDLQVGDRVLTTGGASGTYEPVYSFGHFHETKVSDFVHLEISQNSLSLTANHLIFSNSKSSPIRADEVQVGDVLSSGIVTKVSVVKKQGLYMPLTPSGKVLVNNIEASAYISMSDYAPIQDHPLLNFWLSEHYLSHLWLSPYRMYCMGVSSNYCPSHVKNVDGGAGVMGYLFAGKKVADFALQQNLVVQILIGVPVFATLMTFNAVEMVCGGPSMAPIIMLLVALLLVKSRKALGGQKQKVV